MNDELDALFLEILTKYQAAEEGSILEHSTAWANERAELAAEVDAYRARYEAITGRALPEQEKS